MMVLVSYMVESVRLHGGMLGYMVGIVRLQGGNIWLHGGILGYMVGEGGYMVESVGLYLCCVRLHRESWVIWWRLLR